MQLVQLQRDLSEFQAAGIQVVGLNHDSVEALSNLSATNGIRYPLLSDPDSKTIEAYGILASTGKGVSRPEAFLLDGKGVIRAKRNLEWLLGPALTDTLLDAAPAEPFERQ
jgi:peroxiredoxin